MYKKFNIYILLYMSHNFGRKLPYDSHSFGKKLSHPHNMFTKVHRSVKHFNHSAIPLLAAGAGMGVSGAGMAAGLLKGGEALTGLMSGNHHPTGVSFDGNHNYAKHRRPALER
jgi:hypothetical protein